MSRADVVEPLWRAGDLEYLLRDYQKPLYHEMKRALWGDGGYANPNGKHRRGVARVHRRYGKSHGLAGVPAVELCIQKDGARVYWAAETEKQVKPFLRPIMRRILRDCPEDMRPTWHMVEGELRFPNGSLIMFSGCEDEGKCDRLRGDACDLFIVDEAGSIDLLDYLYKSVVLWMLSTTNGRALMLSTPARTPGHPFTKYCNAAEAGTGWHAHRDVYGSSFTEEQLQELAAECGGKDTPSWRREALALNEIDKETALLPEFDRARHVVKPRQQPTHAHCYAGIDPGTRDMFALVWAYWDPARNKLVVRRSFAKRNITTGDVAKVIRLVEEELWAGVSAWNPETRSLQPQAASAGDWEAYDATRAKVGARALIPAAQPHQRTSDTDSQVILDLVNEFGIFVTPALKDDADAQLWAFRNALGAGLIEFEEEQRGDDARYGELAQHFGAAALHCENGRYNKKRTDWARSEEMGHFDCVAALIYLWRLVSGLRNLNPTPPTVHADDVFVRPSHVPTLAERLQPNWRR